jgi:hypothetical protein
VGVAVRSRRARCRLLTGGLQLRAGVRSFERGLAVAGDAGPSRDTYVSSRSHAELVLGALERDRLLRDTLQLAARPRPMSPVSAWGREALTELRAAVARGDVAAIRAAVADRDLDAVLQLAGHGLLAEPADPLARECAKRLRRRGLDGDAELADALEGRASDLRPLAVDVEELASILESDPVHGGGRVDLATGDVWHQSPYDDPLDNEDTIDDEDRWLSVEASSHEGWWDMSEFIDTVADPELADRLQRMIHGRRAFRRFRDELAEHPDELTRFHLFADERQRGRARRWLAEHGLRSAARNLE